MGPSFFLWWNLAEYGLLEWTEAHEVSEFTTCGVFKTFIWEFPVQSNKYLIKTSRYEALGYRSFRYEGSSVCATQVLEIK